jgi:hypothetical protein
MPINAEACLSLPVNQSVDYAKQDTHIAQACALGGSTKLSEGGFVLVSVEDQRRDDRSIVYLAAASITRATASG